jgi:hypothetical protein
MELEQRQASEEDIPIFRIEEPSPRTHNRVVGLARQGDRQEGRQEGKQEGKQERPEPLAIEQSQTVFDQSRLGNTKSVRRPIFVREEMGNNSKVSNAIEQSSVSGLEG